MNSQPIPPKSAGTGISQYRDAQGTSSGKWRAVDRARYQTLIK